MKPCGLCGKPATGMATINDVRYCHGDDDAEPTCYERAQWKQWGSMEDLPWVPGFPPDGALREYRFEPIHEQVEELRGQMRTTRRGRVLDALIWFLVRKATALNKAADEAEES